MVSVAALLIVVFVIATVICVVAGPPVGRALSLAERHPFPLPPEENQQPD